METVKIKIANRIITFTNETNEENTKTGWVKFKDTDAVNRFYNKVRKLCYTKNFGLDPYNWAAYGQFEIGGYDCYINPPIVSNGDTSWSSYSKGSKKYCKIRITNITAHKEE